jgi:hypothetical protein
MTEQEERELAHSLAEGSRVFDFELALRLVKAKPEEAERLIRMRERGRERQEALARAREELHLAALEFR